MTEESSDSPTAPCKEPITNEQDYDQAQDSECCRRAHRHHPERGLQIRQGNDGHIELRGFGVFEIVTQRPRVGRNPNDPDVRVHIPARKVVKFRAGTELAEKVRKLKVD